MQLFKTEKQRSTSSWTARSATRWMPSLTKRMMRSAAWCGERACTPGSTRCSCSGTSTGGLFTCLTHHVAWWCALCTRPQNEACWLVRPRHLTRCATDFLLSACHSAIRVVLFNSWVLCFDFRVFLIFILSGCVVCLFVLQSSCVISRGLFHLLLSGFSSCCASSGSSSRFHRALYATLCFG